MRRSFAIALVVIGLLGLANALWIPAKALVAQVLLERAWQRAKSGDDARPWSWADTSTVARLRYKQTDLLVLAGSSGRSLAFGPGHMTNSAPVGSLGNVVIAGHRDTHFSFLRTVAPGDLFETEAPDGEVRAYEVFELGVTDASDTTALQPDFGVLTLITCWPFDAVVPGGSGRFVVRARLVS